jgi:hypothetical protein
VARRASRYCTVPPGRHHRVELPTHPLVVGEQQVDELRVGDAVRNRAPRFGAETSYLSTVIADALRKRSQEEISA